MCRRFPYAGASRCGAGWTVQVSLFSIILATVFSLAIGITFGLGPAYKALYLNPIEALRYE